MDFGFVHCSSDYYEGRTCSSFVAPTGALYGMVVLYCGGSLRHGGSLHYGGELFCEFHSAHRATVSPHSLIQTQTNKQTYATIHVRAHTRPLDVLTCFLARTFYIIRAASTQHPATVCPCREDWFCEDSQNSLEHIAEHLPPLGSEPGLELCTAR